MSAPSPKPMPLSRSSSRTARTAVAIADRDVHEEDPVPVDRLGQQAAGQQPDRAARRGDEGVDADRLRLLPRLGEHRDDHAEDHRRGHRAADSLDEAGRDEHLLGLRQPAERARHGEHAEAGHEDALAAEEVAEAAGEQEQAAEGDQVGVDDPGEARLREAEVVLDRRQRDVDDGHVEHDHQHARAEHVESDPAVAVGLHLVPVIVAPRLRLPSIHKTWLTRLIVGRVTRSAIPLRLPEGDLAARRRCDHAAPARRAFAGLQQYRGPEAEPAPWPRRSRRPRRRAARADGRSRTRRSAAESVAQLERQIRAAAGVDPLRAPAAERV